MPTFDYTESAHPKQQPCTSAVGPEGPRQYVKQHLVSPLPLRGVSLLWCLNQTQRQGAYAHMLLLLLQLVPPTDAVTAAAVPKHQARPLPLLLLHQLRPLLLPQQLQGCLLKTCPLLPPRLLLLLLALVAVVAARPTRAAH